MNVFEFNKRLKDFSDWLTRNGGEVLAPTNEWELLRFRGNTGTSIVYTNKRSDLSFTGEAGAAWEAFRKAQPWRANPAASRRRSSGSDVTQRALRERDGDLCFACGDYVTDEEASTDHLVAATSGGPSHIANYVLMHVLCNRRCGHMSAAAKIAMHVAWQLARRDSPITIHAEPIEPRQTTATVDRPLHCCGEMKFEEVIVSNRDAAFLEQFGPGDLPVGS